MTLEGVARRTAEFLFLTIVGPAATAGWIIGDHPTGDPRTRALKDRLFATRIVASFRRMTGGAFHDIRSNNVFGLVLRQQRVRTGSTHSVVQIVGVPAVSGRRC
jgi:hypothetical protein